VTALEWGTARIPGLGLETRALVTGGTGAIGREVALALIQLGATVGVIARSEARVGAVAAELDALGPGRAVPLAADVVDLDSMRRAADALAGDRGLDLVVNAAAVGTTAKPFHEIPEAEIDAMLAVNVKGPMIVAQACLPHLERARGAIVNVSSIAAHAAHAGHGAYGPTKAAVNRLTVQLAVDLGPAGIRANSVSPGQTPTRLRSWDEAPGGEPEVATSKVVGADGIPLRRRGELDDYVGAILFLGSAMARYITGVDIPVEGGALVAL
jgi:NAD(P)-dependent dehydrogenase (short-subunit alcohol dehydrogenase family)